MPQELSSMMTQRSGSSEGVGTGADGTEYASISEHLGAYAAGLAFADLPNAVVAHAKRCLLDSVGIAFASGSYDFARRALCALSVDNVGGRYPVIGFRDRLGRRDAAFLNGVLIHGLDFDDTYVPGVVHASSSALPTALAVGVERHLTGQQMLTGYVLGLEVTSRLGRVAGGAFHQVGFHPTGVLGAFGAAVLAGHLQGMSGHHISQAQGITGSMAAGSLEFLQSGAWTKRLHPGWAAGVGLVAAALAAQGFVGPDKIYEGRFGLFRSHLGADWAGDPTTVLDGLGQDWEMLKIALKPYPACHFTHAFADAALALRLEGVQGSDIESVDCLIAQGEVGTVCEPAQAKMQPSSDYEAKFSLPYVVSTALVKGKVGLNEFGDDTLFDPEITELAKKVTYQEDDRSDFPRYYSGEVVVKTRDGRTLHHREQINRGAEDRPLTDDDVVNKFRENVMLCHSRSFADRILDEIYSIDHCENVVNFAESLQG